MPSKAVRGNHKKYSSTKPLEAGARSVCKDHTLENLWAFQESGAGKAARASGGRCWGSGTCCRAGPGEATALPAGGEAPMLRSLSSKDIWTEKRIFFLPLCLASVLYWQSLISCLSTKGKYLMGSDPCLKSRKKGWIWSWEAKTQ